jgi:hypothetical protein
VQRAEPVLTMACSREANPQHDTLVPYLLREVEDEQGLDMDFFAEAVARMPDDDTIAPLFTKAMEDISARLAKLSMNDDYKPCVNVSGIDKVLENFLLLTFPDPGDDDLLQVPGSSQRLG